MRRSDNPWRSLPTKAPFVLDIDRDGIASFEHRVNARGKTADYGFHVELLPSPFIGNPRASVVLLSLNPGFSERDETDYGDQTSAGRPA